MFCVVWYLSHLAFSLSRLALPPVSHGKAVLDISTLHHHGCTLLRKEKTRQRLKIRATLTIKNGAELRLPVALVR
ncbi:hypothetical protein AAFF_G00426430 [Aldrovandia affinis]|uniref:Secreted protein n=1 Tax=Aldrovandia affinis TaxID=143900 RepID=A0AAD7S9R2_9TELE|nr:hypothetical protein AAFF_G00426430 [Aldrovandia affinis]